MSKKRNTKEQIKEKVAKALVIIANGNSARSACREVDLPISTFIDNAPSERYARARASCADLQFEEMADLEREVLAGTLDYNAFRSAMDSRKWRLARMRPDIYSDRTKLDVSGSLDISALSKARERVKNSEGKGKGEGED